MAEPDAAYHYPPDVFDAVVEAVPLVTRSKQDVLTFFRGCGVDQKLISELAPWAATGSDKSKYHITRRVLTDINELGDNGIRVRRELIKRVTEFDHFDACYPDNRLKAQGAVAALSQLVNRKDAFTRLQKIHEEDQQRARKEREEALAQQAEQRAERQSIRDDLNHLFSMTDAQRRGKALEDVLNRLFRSHGIAIREPFTVTSEGEGVIEQIDGAVELDKRVYLVEMKWWKERLGSAEVSPHLVKVYGRGDVGGIFISNSGYQPSAIEVHKTALVTQSVIMIELREIVLTMERDLPLIDLLRPKLREAALSKNPLYYPLG